MYFDRRAPLPKYLRPFSDRLIASFITCHYWGARQVRPVRIFLFELDDALRAFLTSRPTLSDWGSFLPAMLDPALFEEDEAPLLWTITHEELVFLGLDEEEARSLQTQGLSLKPTTDVTPPIIQENVPCPIHLWGDRLMMLLGIAILLALGVLGFYMIEVLIRAP